MVGPSDSHLVTFINQLSKTIQTHIHFVHALQVRSALLTKNYVLFFQLFLIAPNMGSYLMDPLADKMRHYAIKVMISAYRPKLNISYITLLLAFDTEQECKTYLDSLSIVWLDDTHIDTAATHRILNGDMISRTLQLSPQCSPSPPSNSNVGSWSSIAAGTSQLHLTPITSAPKKTYTKPVDFVPNNKKGSSAGASKSTLSDEIDKLESTIASDDCSPAIKSILIKRLKTLKKQQKHK
jgi:hypothetical protein